MAWIIAKMTDNCFSLQRVNRRQIFWVFSSNYIVNKNLIWTVKTWQYQTGMEAVSLDDKDKQEFIACNMEKRFSSFIGMYGIRNNPAVYKTHYPTGFAKLDETLGGGLTSGLHCLGAISSLGKSTLALQMAENMVSERFRQH